MKSKLRQGQTFGSLMKYLLGSAARVREGAEISGGNMMSLTYEDFGAEFGDIRKLRGDILYPVIHVSLSLVPGEELPDGVMPHDVSKAFLQDLGVNVDKHQWVVVTHRDKAHLHFHIALNKIGDDGSVWDRGNYVNKALASTPRLEERFGLWPTKAYEAPAEVRSPGQVERLLYGDEGLCPKTRLQVAIQAAVEGRPTLAVFEGRLADVGITARLHVAESGKISGYSFSAGVKGFKGSHLGKSFGWAALSQKLDLTDRREEGHPGDERIDPPWLDVLEIPPPEPVRAPSPGLYPPVGEGVLSDLGSLEAALPPYLRGLGSALLVDLSHVSQLKTGVYGFHQTKLNQYARLLGEAPAVEPPELKIPFVPMVVIAVDDQVGPPTRNLSGARRPPPPSRSPRQSPHRVTPRPQGRLIDEYRGRWVVQTTEKVMFSDSAVNDRALRKGFEAAADAYGPTLRLSNFDADMRERAVAVIARTRSLSLVRFDRAEDQAKLGAARAKVEDERRAEAARRQAEIKAAMEKRRREMAARAEARARQQLREIRLARIAAEEEARVKAERLAEARQPWATAVESGQRVIEDLRGRIGSEKAGYDQRRKALAAEVRAADDAIPWFPPDEEALRKLQVTATASDEAIERLPSFQATHKELGDRARELDKRAAEILALGKPSWLNRGKIDRLQREQAAMRTAFNEDRRKALDDCRASARAELAAAGALESRLAAAKKAQAEFEQELRHMENLPHWEPDGRGGHRPAQKEAGPLVDAENADRERVAQVSDLEGRLRDGPQRDLEIWDAAIDAGGAPDAADAAVTAHHEAIARRASEERRAELERPLNRVAMKDPARQSPAPAPETPAQRQGREAGRAPGKDDGGRRR